MAVKDVEETELTREQVVGFKSSLGLGGVPLTGVFIDGVVGGASAGGYKYNGIGTILS